MNLLKQRSLLEKLDAVDDAVKEVREEINGYLPVLEALHKIQPKRVDGKIHKARDKRTERQWQRQGKYLAAIRTLGKGDRGKVRKELRAKGYPSAIRLAKSFRGPAA